MAAEYQQNNFEGMTVPPEMMPEAPEDFKVRPHYNEDTNDGLVKGYKHPPNLPKPFFRLYVVSCSGGGKSVLIADLIATKLRYQGSGGRLGQSYFKQIYIFSKSPDDPALLSLARFPDLMQMIEEDRLVMRDNLDADLLRRLIDGRSLTSEDPEERRELEPTLVVLDDFAGLLSMLKGRTSVEADSLPKLMTDLLFKSRHSKISLIITSQQWTALSKGLRENMDNFILFAPRNPETDLEYVAREISSKELYGAALKQVVMKATAEPHSFIFRNSKGQFFQNFEREIVVKRR